MPRLSHLPFYQLLLKKREQKTNTRLSLMHERERQMTLFSVSESASDMNTLAATDFIFVLLLFSMYKPVSPFFVLIHIFFGDFLFILHNKKIKNKTKKKKIDNLIPSQKKKKIKKKDTIIIVSVLFYHTLFLLLLFHCCLLFYFSAVGGISLTCVCEELRRFFFWNIPTTTTFKRVMIFLLNLFLFSFLIRFVLVC